MCNESVALSTRAQQRATKHETTTTMNTFSTFSSHTSRSRIARFGRGGVSISARGNEPLEESQIRSAVPSIYADGAHSSRSDRYSHIPTGEVLRGLAKEGFQPFEIRQGGSKDEEKRGFTKHLIRLRHASCKELQVGDHVREIVLVNSHDGTSSYQMMGGLFRLVCSNGMVVADGTIDEVRVKHSGDVVHQVLDGCVQILGQLPAASEMVKQWRSLKMGVNEREVFAKAALALRFDDKAPVSPAAILKPRRHEDVPVDLWSTFNVIQENTTKGGLKYTAPVPNSARTKRMSTREVRSVEGNVALNRGLWILAEEMAKLKGAA